MANTTPFATWAGGPGGTPRAAGARRSDRRRVIRAAQLAFGATVLDCALLDMSPCGACIHLLRRGDVPELVTLRLPGGDSRAARCQWRRGERVGLRFAGPALLAAAPGPDAPTRRAGR